MHDLLFRLFPPSQLPLLIDSFFQTAFLDYRPSEIYLGSGSLLTMAVLLVMVTIVLKVMLVYAAKVLGEYGVEAMMAKSANSTESRPGALRRLRSCRAAWG